MSSPTREPYKSPPFSQAIDSPFPATSIPLSSEESEFVEEQTSYPNAYPVESPFRSV